MNMGLLHSINTVHSAPPLNSVKLQKHTPFSDHTSRSPPPCSQSTRTSN